MKKAVKKIKQKKIKKKCFFACVTTVFAWCAMVLVVSHASITIAPNQNLTKQKVLD